MNLKESWSQLIDNFSFVKNILKGIKNWGQETIWKKILVYLLFSAIVFSLPSYYIYTLFESSVSITDSNRQERNYIGKKHSLESAIEIVNICIAGRDKKLMHESFYCGFAKDMYSQFNELTTIDTIAFEKAKNEEAYELMVLDLRGQLMILENSKLERNLPKDTFGEKLSFLLRDIVIYTFLCIYIALMIGLFTLFNWRRS